MSGDMFSVGIYYLFRKRGNDIESVYCNRTSYSAETRFKIRLDVQVQGFKKYYQVTVEACSQIPC